MRTLTSVIEAAIKRSAAEITLHSEQPVVFRTARGNEAESATLRRADLFDMLTSAVSDEHQVELMLGNPIEFDFEVERVKWRVQAIPSADAMIVRAEREGGRAQTEADEFSVELEEFDDPDLAADARKPRAAKGIPAPFDSGTWSLDEDDDSEFELTDAPPAKLRRTTSSTPVASPRRTTASTPAASRRTTGSTPSVARVGSAAASREPTTAKDIPVVSDDFETIPDLSEDFAPVGATMDEIPAQSSSSTPTRMELEVVRSPDADTQRELAARPVELGPTDFGTLAAEVDPGTLVYLLERGMAEQLANAVQAPTIVLDDEVDPSKLWTRIRGLPSGSILIVKWEDPSWWLGWILRRLEEGYRVLVDSRARTAGGAWRILLGTTSTVRAEAWLASQRQLVVEPGVGGPRLTVFTPPSR